MAGYYDGKPPWMAQGLRKDGYSVLDPRNYRNVPVDTLSPTDVWTMLQEKIKRSGPDFLLTDQELHERNDLERKIREMRHTQPEAALTSQELRRALQEKQLQALRERDAQIKKALQEGVE